MDTPLWIHLGSRSISRRYVEDQISTNFQVISKYFFLLNFDGWKIHVVYKFFFDVISLAEKSTLCFDLHFLT